MSLSPAMKEMLRSMTPAQIETMIQPASQPRPTVDMPKNMSRGKGKKKVGNTAGAGKTTRPLNSWIAFRSYYSAAFPRCQQKDISGFLTVMWQEDPFKAKWTILAKVYSLIRDSQGKDNAPLDEFLAITGPLIGIIKPQKYLETTGWEIAKMEGGQTIMRRYEVPLDEYLFANSFSVNDLVRYCHQMGYATGNVANMLALDGEVTMTKISSIQHHDATGSATLTQPHGLELEVTADTEGEEVEDIMDQQGSNVEPTDNIDSSDNSYEVTQGFAEIDNAQGSSTESTVANEGPTVVISDPHFEPSSKSFDLTFDNTNVGPETLAATDQGNESQNQTGAGFSDPNPASGLSAANFQLTSEYPFNAEFDPNLPGFVFDPFLGNQFDVFDMSDIAWTDVIDFDGQP